MNPRFPVDEEEMGSAANFMNNNNISTVGQVAAAMDRLAPPALAQPWDNVGLLIGAPAALCRRVLLAIDLTAAVLDEAISRKCQAIIAYHPPLFQPIKSVRADHPGTESIVHRTIAAGLAVYAPHTALDAAAGGTNDVLGLICGLTDVTPFEYVHPGPRLFKIVTFVPAEQLDQVSAAMFAAGAGRIGDYEQCSYRLRGEGTFFGTESTAPRVGRRGRLETVPEIRLEMVVPESALPAVTAALRRHHPYEEPAFDVYPLTPPPATGIGRVGRLPGGMTLGRLAGQLQRGTRSKIVTLIGAKTTRLKKAAVCVGAAGRLPLEKPNCADCDVIVTGEIRHHDALAILRNGKTAVACGHWESERPVLKPLVAGLSKALPRIEFLISRRDTGPFVPQGNPR